MSKKVKNNPKKKKTVKKEKPTTGNALFDFLLDKAGGQEAARRDFARERIAKLPKGTAVRELQKLADDEGWSQILDTMTLGDLRGPVPASKVKRQPRGAAEETRKAVMKCLTEHAGVLLSTRQVADFTGLDARKVGRALGDLVKAGAVTRTGSKRDSRYSKAS